MTLANNVTVYTSLNYVVPSVYFNQLYSTKLSTSLKVYFVFNYFISFSLRVFLFNQSTTGRRCPQALSNGPLSLARIWDKGTLHLLHLAGRL